MEIIELYGNEQAQETGPATQVYRITHNDDERKSYMDRSFISFSYGGKYIEDFNLIVTFDSGRLERGAYAEFEDIVSQPEVLDGQFYWMTHFNNNSLDLTLSTDEITERELESFKKWFRPGVTRELILSEHPNRGIMARIDSVPQEHFIPFEKETSIKIGGITRYTKTTLYRGYTTISFVMDDPHWYSLYNILSYEDENGVIDYDRYKNAQGDPIFIYKDADVTKIILEDNVPAVSMFNDGPIMVGSDVIVNNGNILKTKVGPTEEYADIADNDQDRDSGLVGPLLEVDSNLGTFNDGAEEARYFYYAGTARAKPILTFVMTPILDSNNYISSPKNSFTGEQYNTITIESQTKKLFKFTTPSIWTAYNQAIAIMTEMDGQPLADVRRAIRIGVNHHAARAYAIQVACAGDGNLTSDSISKMKNFLNDDEENIMPAGFVFNFKTGRYIGVFSYRNVDETIVEEQEEEVGDMIRSSYFFIEDRNFPDEDGYIRKWEEDNPQYTHRIYHDVEGGLENFLIFYKHMYL